MNKASHCMAIAALLGIAGCAGVPADLGRGDVDALVAARGQPTGEMTSALLEELVAVPLTRDSAVRIALLNNPALQATYANLGFGAADIYEAGRIRNPVFAGSVLSSSAAGEQDQVTLGLAVSFTDLITLAARKRLSEGAFMSLKQSVGAEVLYTAAQAEKAYFAYVGARQVAALRAKIAEAGSLSAQLAARFRDAGNLSARELALQRAAASETRLQSLRAEAEEVAARTYLAGILGLSSGAAWQVPGRLHPPLDVEDDLDELLLLANEYRLDLAAARSRADVLADRLGVVNWTRWLGDLDIGYERERETDGVRLTGPTLDWELPIFNQHRDAVLRADAELRAAVADVRRMTVAVDNEVRLAFAAVANARARAQEYETALIPQRIETVARGQEEVNYMLIGIFELISLKQEEYDAYQGYLEAIRDYWVARADLGLASGTALPSSKGIGQQTIDVNDFIKPQPGGMDHSGHGDGMDHSMHQQPQETGHQHHNGDSQ